MRQELHAHGKSPRRLRFACGEQDPGQGVCRGRSSEMAGAPGPQSRAIKGCCFSAKLLTQGNPRSGKQKSQRCAGWRGHHHSATPSGCRQHCCLLIFYRFLFLPTNMALHWEEATDEPGFGSSGLSLIPAELLTHPHFPGLSVPCPVLQPAGTALQGPGAGVAGARGRGTGGDPGKGTASSPGVKDEGHWLRYTQQPFPWELAQDDGKPRVGRAGGSLLGVRAGCLESGWAALAPPALPGSPPASRAAKPFSRVANAFATLAAVPPKREYCMDGLFPFQQGSALGDNLPMGEGLRAFLRLVPALEHPLHNVFFPWYHQF